MNILLVREGDYMKPTEKYIHDRDEQVRKNMEDSNLRVNAHRFAEELARTNYVKNFTWMGRPILQLPTDLMVMQELIWQIKPDYIIETGVAFGGMMVFYAGILEAMGGSGEVIGIDIEYRQKNVEDMDKHPLRKRIRMLEGNSIEPSSATMLKAYVGKATILVSLDSNHTHDHVLQELRLYSPLVSLGSYIVVFDTAIEEFSHLINPDRPWGVGDNPATAVREFMQGNEEFLVDREIEQRALITAAPGGWLKRVREAS